MAPRKWCGIAVTCVLTVALGAAGLRQASGAKGSAPKPPEQSAAKLQAEVEAQSVEERVHTAGGLVTVTKAPKATEKDLGVAVFAGASEKASSLWRLTPAKGAEWLRAQGSFTSTAALDAIEQFYRKALGNPEIRRVRKGVLTVVVLSRLQGAEAIIVRVSSAGTGKPADILIRRAVKGAPLTLEPSGELPRRAKPRPKRPSATPVSAG